MKADHRTAGAVAERLQSTAVQHANSKGTCAQRSMRTGELLFEALPPARLLHQLRAHPHDELCALLHLRDHEGPVGVSSRETDDLRLAVCSCGQPCCTEPVQRAHRTRVKKELRMREKHGVGTQRQARGTAAHLLVEHLVPDAAVRPVPESTAMLRVQRSQF